MTKYSRANKNFFRFENRGFVFRSGADVSCYFIESKEEFDELIDSFAYTSIARCPKDIWNGPGWYLYQSFYSDSDSKMFYRLTSWESLKTRMERLMYRFENGGDHREDDLY